MRVLVTGHEGYLGTVLVPLLRNAGHEVVGLDTGLFADCTLGPDPLTGFGRLDVGAAVKALDGPIPVADRLEPNDDAGSDAATVYRPLNMRATLDAWDDATDVYRVHLRRGQRLSVYVRSGPKIDTSIVLWKPGLHSLSDARSDLRAKRSVHGLGVAERIVFRARRTAWYSLQVKLARPGHGPYRIRLAF